MSLKKFKILFITADPGAEADVRQKLSDVRTAIFSVVVAHTLANTFALLKQESFDVFLVDLAVPDSRGISSLRRLI